MNHSAGAIPPSKIIAVQINWGSNIWVLKLFAIWTEFGIFKNQVPLEMLSELGQIEGQLLGFIGNRWNIKGLI
jgi:hypothetical protein